MRDFYIVTHQAGAAGAFFNTLVYGWVAKQESIANFQFDEYGAAHGDLEGVAVSNHQNGSNHPVTQEHSSLIPCWPWLKAKDNSKPLCVRSHCLVDDTINDYYPNHQHFHILTNPHDYELIAFNVYIKQQRFNVWSEQIAKQKIKEIENFMLEQVADHGLEHQYWFKPYIRPNTINILYTDIMTNPKKVHEQMSEVLGDVPNYVVEYHDKYILENKQVVAKYAPWITYYS